MNLLNRYFSNLIFTRIEDKQGYSIYGACVASMMGGGFKNYVLVFVPVHLAIKSRARISELPWKNLQTRKIQYGYRLKMQKWKGPPDGVPDILLRVSKRNKRYSEYISDDPNFPFEILLLHESKKKTRYQYNNKIMLSTALESFNSVFNYIGKQSPMYYTTGSSQTPLPNIAQPTLLDSVQNLYYTIPRAIPQKVGQLSGISAHTTPHSLNTGVDYTSNVDSLLDPDSTFELIS